MSLSARMYLCARCRLLAVVCRRCDRGQIYCTAQCSQQARRSAQRDAGRRYQSSRAGRFAHAARARRYRARIQFVTHQGSTPAPADDLLRTKVATTVSTEQAEPARATDSSTRRCIRCRACVPAWVRRDFLRYRPRPFDHRWPDRPISTHTKCRP
jgi:hypothetical protein